MHKIFLKTFLSLEGLRYKATMEMMNIFSSECGIPKGYFIEINKIMKDMYESRKRNGTGLK